MGTYARTHALALSGGVQIAAVQIGLHQRSVPVDGRTGLLHDGAVCVEGHGPVRASALRVPLQAAEPPPHKQHPRRRLRPPLSLLTQTDVDTSPHPSVLSAVITLSLFDHVHLNVGSFVSSFSEPRFFFWSFSFEQPVQQI